MTGRPIEELDGGLVLLKDELNADPLAAKRVQVGVVTFGPVLKPSKEFRPECAWRREPHQSMPRTALLPASVRGSADDSPSACEHIGDTIQPMDAIVVILFLI